MPNRLELLTDFEGIEFEYQVMCIFHKAAYDANIMVLPRMPCPTWIDDEFYLTVAKSMRFDVVTFDSIYSELSNFFSQEWVKKVAFYKCKLDQIGINQSSLVIRFSINHDGIKSNDNKPH